MTREDDVRKPAGRMAVHDSWAMDREVLAAAQRAHAVEETQRQLELEEAWMLAQELAARLARLAPAGQSAEHYSLRLSRAHALALADLLEASVLEST